MKKFFYGLIVVLAFSISIPAQAQGVKSSGCSSLVQNLKVKNLSNPTKSIDDMVGNFDNEIKIIYSDIDGTILKFNKENRNAPMSENLKQSVKKLQKAQIPLVLVTGRSYHDAKEVANKIGNPNVYIVANQGADIIDPSGAFIYKEAFSEADTAKMFKELKSFKKLNNFDSKVYFFVDGKTYSTENFQPPYIFEDIVLIKSLKQLGSHYSCAKVAIYETDKEKLKQLQAHLRKVFPSYKIDIAADGYCDISTASTTKGNAIEKISKITGTNLKNAATFGDAENDISMLSLVKSSGGLAVAMGNAIDSLKQNANYVTYSVGDDGVARAIDKILLNNELLKKHSKVNSH